LANGKQPILASDDYIIPLGIVQGLAYMKIWPPSDDQLHTLPHVIFTSNEGWEPTIHDNINSVNDSNESSEHLSINNVDNTYFSNVQALCYNLKTTGTQIEYKVYQLKFGWTSIDIIQKTFQNTKQ
jgi:hypothetical protein